MRIMRCYWREVERNNGPDWCSNEEDFRNDQAEDEIIGNNDWNDSET